MSTSKRDTLTALEAEIQKKWETERIFEQDAPQDGDAKRSPEDTFLVTFPYPYMNGMLHLGHAFTISKAEFAVGYQMLKGKHCLFPFGFHVTGMPIKAAADKLTRELAEAGGTPPAPFDPSKAEEEEKEKVVAKVDPTKFTGAKTKLQQKKSGGKSLPQWDIMRRLGYEDKDISNFCDPTYWVKHFPPLAIRDLKLFGAHIDWRRSFITTELNPYYDSFVRWQFENLKEQGKIKFGKRNSIYSPKDGQPCADHERSKGEGVLPQDYTLIKMEVTKELNPSCVFAGLLDQGKKVFLVAATLRPETMYGQTNCWVHPEGKYLGFQVNAEGDVFICAKHTGRNLAFQGLAEEFGKVNRVFPPEGGELTGKQLLGLKLKAPLCTFEYIHVLPMVTVVTTKGTGIVTSVPSDAPMDYAALKDLQSKPDRRKYFGIEDDWVMPFNPVPILNTPEYGDLCAVKIADDMKINGPNDPRLEEAKGAAYKAGFYEGVMTVGEFKGSKVIDVKDKIKDDLISKGHAVPYSEPASEVVSRSGDTCVVCLMEQWYLDYGEDEWKALTEKALEKLNCYHDATRSSFKATLNWLKQWAVSRSFGLGTRLPCDEKYLIESLSDSTVYMAYYTVAHMLQGENSLDGSKRAYEDVKAEDMTKEVWDFILLGKDAPSSSPIPQARLEAMRKEFLYWYPVNLRVSGKDLVGNHLTFFLYNHTALFPEEHWPLGVRSNGHLLLNNAKMAKQTGNFLTLNEAVKKYGADGTRLALADSGDVQDDANFTDESANKGLISLYNILKWIEDEFPSFDTLREGEAKSFQDKLFEAQINLVLKQCDAEYEKCNYKEVLVHGLYEFTNYREVYRSTVGPEGVSKALMQRYIEAQILILAPIASHTCEHLWSMIGKTGSVFRARYPAYTEPNTKILAKRAYIDQVVSGIKTKAKYNKSKKLGHTNAIVWIGGSVPEWQNAVKNVLLAHFDEATNDFTKPKKALLGLVMKDKVVVEQVPKKRRGKEVMSICNSLMEESATNGKSALVTGAPVFDEFALWNSLKEYISLLAGVTFVAIHKNDDPEGPKDEKKSLAVPFKPYISFQEDKAE